MIAEDQVITVAAVVVRDAQGRILTVRKKGTSRFQFPGGKPESGETYLATAVRECAEEVQLALDPADLSLVGCFIAPAGNEAGFVLEETLFVCRKPIDGEPQPAAEIEEVRWLDPSQPLPPDLAPLLNKAIPQLPHRRPLHTVTFYTGSAGGDDPSYTKAVRDMGTACARHGLDVVFGGGSVGLMGTLADATLDAGGHAIGVMPRSLVDAEIAHPRLTQLEVVDDLSTREARLAELGDAMVALPGGAGTLAEFFDAWTRQQLGIHDKLVALYNVHDFWKPLLNAIGAMSDLGFIDRRFIDSLIVVDNPDDLIEALTTWRPPSPKWQ